jgi:hypothetical protein
MRPEQSGGGYYKLDVSWRKAEPIDVLVNPWGPEAPKMIEALARTPDTRGRPGYTVSFQLNALGMLWFAPGSVGMHGDEYRGRIIPTEHDKESVREGSLTAPTLVYGGIMFDPGNVIRLDAKTFAINVYSADALLACFTTWRRAWDRTSLDTWHPRPKATP